MNNDNYISTPFDESPNGPTIAPQRIVPRPQAGKDVHAKRVRKLLQLPPPHDDLTQMFGLKKFRKQ